MFWKSNVSYPLIHTHTCTYQGIRNVRFSENHVDVPNEWPLNKNHNYGVVLENVDFNIDSSSRGKLLVVILQVLNISDSSFKISCLVTIIFEGLILNSQLINFIYIVDVYKCHVERSDCTLCLIAPAEWNCVWCNSTLVTSKCGISNSCDSYWSNDACAGPEINSVRMFVPYFCANLTHITSLTNSTLTPKTSKHSK